METVRLLLEVGERKVGLGTVGEARGLRALDLRFLRRQMAFDLTSPSLLEGSPWCQTARGASRRATDISLRNEAGRPRDQMTRTA